MHEHPYLPSPRANVDPIAIPAILFGRGGVFSLVVSRTGLDSPAVSRPFYKPQVRVARGRG